MKLLPLLALSVLGACATLGASPDLVQPFPLNTAFTERQADPGKVDLKCYNKGGHLDNGQLKGWNDTYCGCVDFKNSIVWISRRNTCNLKKTRVHEGCHTVLGPSPVARKICDDNFKV